MGDKSVKNRDWSGARELSEEAKEALKDMREEKKIKTFFEHFQALPTWFTNLWILVCASIFGIKGTQIFRNNGGKK